MRLGDFITANLHAIIAEWEVFARSTAPGAAMDGLALRDHAADILRATVRDMSSAQTPLEQSDKSKGQGGDGKASSRLNDASDVHAIGRVGSGFDLIEVVAEYRALRASVIRLWRQSEPVTDLHDLDDLTRFNESIDQSLTTAVESYTHRVDQSREMFLAILGHDLRNPLNSMMMSAELLLMEGNLGAEDTDTAKQITTSAVVMTQMISDLLDYTRTRLGAGMPVSPNAMDLQPLCRAVFDEFQSSHPSRVMRFTAAGDTCGAWDSARMRQAISNLLANALQHGDEKAPVELVIEGAATEVRVLVRNQGRPIPAEALPTLFNPLVRGDSIDAPGHHRAGSIGLGLYIVRELAAAHGGTIEVISTAAAGTLFTLHLPRTSGKKVDGNPRA